MLPKLHHQVYQSALNSLLELQDCLRERDLDTLEKKFKEVQSLFLEQVFSLSEEGIDPAIASRWQSIQTEMHRTLKLLETDLLFLRSSRQVTTSEQRLKIVGDRLNQLIGFCQEITRN